MINITEKKNCCGCGACAQSCPVGCITMTADGEGFLYPVVDVEKCVNCGLCDRVCPILNPGVAPKDIRVYAAMCNDEEVRRTSSSGGVFYLLAEQALSDGGVVLGAAFDADFSVHHVMVERIEDLPMIMGSKYLQSRIENTYVETEKELKKGRSVLFSGTGCQISGLKSYLHREYNNLYTIDVFCHGVPSPNVWRKYLDVQKRTNDNGIRQIYFRAKTQGWHQFSMRIEFNNGETYDCPHREDAFMKVFLENLCLRPSCYDCKFLESRSGADLTIGDAWGVENWMAHMDDNKGTSVVVVNTEKGRRLWAAIQGKLRSEEGDKDAILSCNPVYVGSVRPHPKREKFFSAFSAGASMEELVSLAKKPLWRRAISFAKRCVKKLLKLCGIRIE